MFQGMFRKRGRPPEQIPIGGYNDSSQPNQQQERIPVHQSLVSLEEPRQLPLQPVREFGHDVIVQERNDSGNVPNMQIDVQQQVGNQQNGQFQDRISAFDPQQRNIVNASRSSSSRLSRIEV